MKPLLIWRCSSSNNIHFQHEQPQNPTMSETDAVNGSNGICRVIDATFS
jgi:hypothetical protein